MSGHFLFPFIFLSGFKDKVVVSARKINLQAVSSLFGVQFSGRSGLVKDVKSSRVHSQGV